MSFISCVFMRRGGRWRVGIVWQTVRIMFWFDWKRSTRLRCAISQVDFTRANGKRWDHCQRLSLGILQLICLFFFCTNVRKIMINVLTKALWCCPPAAHADWNWNQSITVIQSWVLNKIWVVYWGRNKTEVSTALPAALWSKKVLGAPGNVSHRQTVVQ